MPVMYPNAIVAWNIFAETMIGKLIIKEEEGHELKAYDVDAGKEFVEDIITENNLFTGHKWFGLPSFDDLNEIITDELKLEPIGVDKLRKIDW